MGIRANTQCLEDMTTSRQITTEGVTMYAGKSGQCTLAYELVSIV